MKQTLATIRKRTHDFRHGGFDPRKSAARLRERHRMAISLPRVSLLDRFCPDWFALRIWEDDGGGQFR